ncbi:MAG: hypothetical protein ACFCGT_20345 [Sandaracinaceae bacterium]
MAASAERARQVYLLDDDPGWLRALARLLAVEGLRPRTFADPASLLEGLVERVPALVVLDFALGVRQTGADVARLLRRRLGAATPALVLLSGGLTEVSEADRAAFDRVLSKDAPVGETVQVIVGWARPSVVRSSVRLKGLASPAGDEPGGQSGVA